MKDDWQHDMTTAPLDAVIWIATKCGKVIRSYWLPEADRWCFLSAKETPIAWHSYFKPAHPSEVAP